MMQSLTLPAKNTNHRNIHVLLWVVQILLALLFLFSGIMKLVMPIEMMTKGMPSPLPGWFLRFIGIVEALGALGLILPGVTRIATFLTPLAGLGLTLVMIGAVAITTISGGLSAAIVPLIVGALAAFIAYGRWRLAPHRGH